MPKFSLTPRPLLSGLLLTVLLPSCKTVDYVMWEWNPLQKTPKAAEVQNALNSSQPAPASSQFQYTQPIQHPSYAYPQATASAVSRAQPPINTAIKVTPQTSLPPTPPSYVKATPRPTPKPKPKLVAKVAAPPKVAPTPVKKSGKVGKVTLVNGLAIAPANAPQALKDAVRAGNDMQSMPYVFGGGHAKLDNDVGYDCSGTTSYVLRAAGLMKGSNTSIGFLNYGQSGEGEYLTVWAKKGHVFLVVGGLRLDTGGSLTRTGPRWKPAPRSMKGFIPRHPPGH